MGQPARTPQPDDDPPDWLTSQAGNSTPPPAEAETIPPRAGDDSPPPRLGPYQLLTRIAEGGMGVVYRARDTALNREVAVKVVRHQVAPNAEARARFVREAQTAAQVRHPRVVEIYAADVAADVAYLVMPLLNGESLSAVLAGGALPVAEAVRIGREMAEGLSAVHAAGIVHRDVKPANVFLEAPGRRVQLLDFGLARREELSDKLTRTGLFTGTYEYVSPEQAVGDSVNNRSDVFSLGSVLYQAATGRAPFTGDTPCAVLRAITETHPAPPHRVRPSVPRALSELIVRMLAPKPADRPGAGARGESR
jgi:eukaryotic-like serine/threonine-protein kinase